MKEFTFQKTSQGVKEFNDTLYKYCKTLFDKVALWGYKIEKPFWKDLGSKDYFFSLDIEQALYGKKFKYLPNIYIDRFSAMPKFSVQTTSYGELSVSEFKDFMEMQQAAYFTAGFLANYDWKKIPIVKIADDVVYMRVQ